MTLEEEQTFNEVWNRARKRSTENVIELLSHPKIKPSIRNNDNKRPLDIVLEDSYPNSENENVLKHFDQKEKKLTEYFCLAMIQPPLSPTIRQNKKKKLRRDELRLPSELTKFIASFLDWNDISNKSCNEF